MGNVSGVSTSNRYAPIKVEINPTIIPTVNDLEWHKVGRKPTNNRPAPKKINLEKALETKT